MRTNHNPLACWQTARWKHIRRQYSSAPRLLSAWALCPLECTKEYILLVKRTAPHSWTRKYWNQFCQSRVPGRNTRHISRKIENINILLLNAKNQNGTDLQGWSSAGTFYPTPAHLPHLLYLITWEHFLCPCLFCRFCSSPWGFSPRLCEEGTAGFIRYI